MKSIALSICFLLSFCNYLSAEEVKSLMAKPGKLLFDDQGEAKRGKGVKLSKINENWNVRANMGIWEKKDGFYQSSWKPGIGHTPVMAYLSNFKNVIIEVTFRYNEMKEDWHTHCFRIALDNRKLYTGHILSAWANPNNDFIEKGFLLQHISKNKDKSIIADILFDKQAIKYEVGKWHTAILEVVDNKALFHMDGNLAYTESDRINVEKSHFSLTLGKTLHDVKRVRVWDAKLKSNWQDTKKEILSKRVDFKAQPHTYKKPVKK